MSQTEVGLEIDTNDHHGGKHKDGSGAIAIKMVHTDSQWSIISDVIRLIFSICLLIFSAISVIYAIATSATTMPDSFSAWSQYLCLLISLFILGVLEGLQIAVVELAHKDPSQYKKLHPRAAKLLAFENKGRNVERFLMGRQVLVVFTVFVAARITTFDGFWAEVPQSLVYGLMYSGFLGVVLVVIVAQLTPQVLAAAYPVEFLNLYGMNIAFWACLIVEATGLVHAVWFLCVTVRKLVYKCICNKYETDGDDGGFERVASKSPDQMGSVRDDMKVTNDMLKAAEKAEIDIEESIEMAKKQKNKGKREHYGYKKEYKADNDDVDDQMNSLIEDVGNNRDLFYIYGDKKFMSPAQCYDKFKNAGLEPPQFLLPPDNDNHIPPHIVAMTLLKMYTQKNEDNNNDNQQN